MSTRDLFLSLPLLLLAVLAFARPVSAQPALLHIEEAGVERRESENLNVRRNFEESDICSIKCRQYSSNNEETSVGEEGSVPVGAFTLGMWVGSLDLGRSEVLGWGSDVSAIDPMSLGSLGEHMVGGLRLGGRLESLGFLRAPEYQLTLIGGEIDGPWRPSSANGIEARGLRATSIGFSIAAGAQIPVGPLRFYGLLRIGVRLGILEVGLRQAGGGTLGQQSLITGSVQAGFEGGVEVELDRETLLQLAATVDPASGAYGGALSAVMVTND